MRTRPSRCAVEGQAGILEDNGRRELKMRYAETYEATESSFEATAEKGAVSSLLLRPDEARWLLVLGHGASTNMRHRTLQTIAERLADVGIATFRYNFP